VVAYRTHAFLHCARVAAVRAENCITVTTVFGSSRAGTACANVVALETASASAKTAVGSFMVGPSRWNSDVIATGRSTPQRQAHSGRCGAEEGRETGMTFPSVE
jgi:hypothetical protein